MAAPSVEQLDALKYAELQKIAKTAGLRANLKAEQLRTRLKQHFHPAAGSELAKEENNNEKGEETAGRGSSSKKRARTEDVISETMKVCPPGNPSPAAKVPRTASRLPKPGSKFSTPNFKKLHEAHFRKMESIDKFMERKQKRLDAVGTSIQEVKMMAMKSNLLAQAEKTPVRSSEKLLQSKYFILSPGIPKRPISPLQSPASGRRSGRKGTTTRSIMGNKSAIKPLTQSESKMNVRFSATTKDNEHKQSLVKTPARKSSFGKAESEGRSCTPRKIQLAPDGNKSDALRGLESDANEILPDENKINQSALTPFKFTAQSTPSTNKKLKFDLQASLSRPLGYQPHKGKLRPWGEGEAKENSSGTRSTAATLKNHFKQPVLQTRDDRRKRHEEGRKQKREQALGARRGVAAQ